MAYHSWARTDVGKSRRNNEDRFLADDRNGLYVVADGVGGHVAGEVASAWVIASFERQAGPLRQLASRCHAEGGGGATRRAVFDALSDLVEAINHEVYSEAQRDPEKTGMATTVSALLLSPTAAFIVHVGDSRIYLLRDGGMQRITTDHTLAEELVRAGRLTPDEVKTYPFRNIIARSVGEKGTVDSDLLHIEVLPGDLFVVCSDGLTDYCDESAVAAALAGRPDEHSVARLVDLANDGGGGDNITAIVARADDLPDRSRTETDVAVVAQMTWDAKIPVLRELFFCRHLTDEELMHVLRYVEEVEAESGADIVRQGEADQDLYIVVDGRVDVIVDGVVVTTIGSGGHFGEIALVRGQERSATVRASQTTLLFRLTREDFYDLSQKDQRIAIKMLWAFAQTLAERVIELSTEMVGRR